MPRNRRPLLSFCRYSCHLARLFLCFFLLYGPVYAAVSFPKPEGWVTDLAGLIDPPTRGRMEQLLAEVQRISGVEIAVVTLPTLGEKSIEEAAVELFQAWGIGKKGVDEGLLLLVAPKERKIRIEVGYGLEETIPDGLAGQIIRETITPRFRQGRFAEGIETGIRQIVETIAKQKQLDLTTLHVTPSRTTAGRLGIDQRRVVSRATIFFALMLVALVALAIANERSLRPGRRGTGRFRRRFFGFPGIYPGGGWSGGAFGSGGSGGFGGFGGGSSGGGGASGGW